MNKSTQRLLLAGAGVAAIAAVNNYIFTRAKAQGNPLGGDGRFWPGPYGDLFYTRQGKGKPVVLLHGIYYGASGYEWRKNFDRLSEHFSVYAVDWLGYGLSDKPRIRYTSSLYIEQLKQFLVEVVKEPCALIASSLASAYAIQASHEIPDHITDLVMIEPTGLRRMVDSPDAKSEVVYQLLHAPLIGTTFHNLIASMPSLKGYLMNRAYFDPSHVDDEMVGHYSTAAHQYGSQNAPPSFVAGLLNHNVATAFPKLTQHTIRLVWGREAVITPLSDAEAFLAANGRAELTIFDKSGMSPHDEQAQAFNRLVVEQLTDHPAKPKRARAAKKEDE